jgi:thiol-disulfide isomerase/thioredoxin
MKRSRDALLIAVVGAVAMVAGYGYNAWRTAPDAASEHAVAALTAAKLPDLTGTPQPLDQWRGKVVLVNFWATWCAPCREEIPMLVKLQEKYGARGLQLVGIAIDQPEKVRPYAAEMRMNFPILIGSSDGIALARELGNKAAVLPFTLVMDRNGKIIAREVGALKAPQIEGLVSSLL